MADRPVPHLPALLTREIGESEYRALVERAAAGDRLAARVRDLEREVVALETSASLRREASEDLLLALLPVADDLERAIRAARASQDHAAIVEGVGIVQRELERVLGLHQVSRLAVAAGDDFDPDQHQLVDETGLDREPPVVAEELRPGYRRGKRLLRRAIVRLEPGGPA